MPKKTTSKSKKAPGKLAGKTLALVGKFGYKDSGRERYEGRARRAGGKLVDATKTNPDYLIVGEGQRGNPPAIVAVVQKRHPAVQVFDLAGMSQLLAPTADELLAEIAAGDMDSDRWDEIHEHYLQIPKPPDLSGTDFRKAQLSAAHLAQTVLTECDFRGADLSTAELAGDRPLERAKLDDANLYAAEVRASEDCQFRGADLHHARLTGYFQVGARHVRADFRRANMNDVRAGQCEFVDCSFREADLSDAQIEKARFIGADFIAANLTRAQAHEAKFERANFTGAILRRTDLRKALLTGADLTRADLREAVLTGADLTGAKVDGADFAGANLTGARFLDVDTSRAKNFQPPVVRAPGRALLAFAQLAGTSKSFVTTVEVDLGAGEFALLQITTAVDANRRWIYARSTYRRDDKQTTDRVDAPSFEQGLLNLADRWPNPTLRLDSIQVRGAKTVRGKKLQEMALAAWSEAFGIQATSAADLVKTKENQQAAVQQLRDTMLAELRGGPSGITKWNARTKRDKEQIGPLAGLDLSGMKLDGLVVENGDLRGCNFAGASLKGARLFSSKLDGANFDGANLDKASLTYSECPGASFDRANLMRASLSTTKLQGANLRDADLTNASLDFAHLEGTDLTGAKVQKVDWKNAYYNSTTKFPAGFTTTDEMERVPDPPPAPGSIPEAAPGSLDFAAFHQRLAGCIDPGRLKNATRMLKAERFQLFSDVKPDSLLGVVRSQTSKDLVYSCRLAADGTFGCCTQNLRPCGGLGGAVCKHLLVLTLGLAKATQVDPATVANWLEASRSKKPELNKDAMGDAFLKYKGAEAGEIDWRPTETIPEDFYAV
jgi:uncharacterized protein YjbI with pentapeptide repeats